MGKYKNIKSEHQLRNLVFEDYFKRKGVSFEQEIDKIDFILTDTKSRSNKEAGAEKHYIWMEVKKSTTEQYIMLSQLLLTIKKIYDKNEYTVPNYAGCFDPEKIIFVPMKLLRDVLKDNAIKWNITPSDTKNPYFLQILNKLKYVLFNNKEVKIFTFGENEEEIKQFINKNVFSGIVENKFEITEHNFDRIYLKWVKKVKPSIAVNWEEEKKNGILDLNFYLADLIAKDDYSIKDKLLIVLHYDHYQLTKLVKKSKILIDDEKYYFKDKQKAHKEFWSMYERPPLEKYWNTIINRKDLLVPQDIRERKGSFFTPQEWVELSQQYISDVFGQDWQNNYYVWDCCAGTGNLLVGVNRKQENVFASTIDASDVKAIQDGIDNGIILLKKNNVFQFDFLNDDFKKLPKALKAIIDDPEKRKKLIIYINPPYAEAGNTKQKSGTGENKGKTSIDNAVYEKYKDRIGKASNDLYAQFLIRIFDEINGCIIANFSKLKNIQSPNFKDFRNIFKPELKKLFLVPSYTFDNVRGKFPIGFFIWNTSKNKIFKKIKADIYDENSNFLGVKNISSNDNIQGSINNWLSKLSKNNNEKIIGIIHSNGNDFQHQDDVFIDNDKTKKTFGGAHIKISCNNIKEASILYAVRHCIKANWINDRDQFLFPNYNWKKDIEFQDDCFMYTLFNTNISCEYDINFWIPYNEDELNISKKKFDSNYMSNYINGKLTINEEYDLFNQVENKKIKKIHFSKEAKEVFNAGKELWKYYHSFPRVEVNASLYDIKGYFQGFENNRMNNKSDDTQYNELIGELRNKLKLLAQKIEPKVYEYGFLLE
jgi:hypothetical protein